MPNDNRWFSENTSSRSDVRARSALTDPFYNSRENRNINKPCHSHVGLISIPTMPANGITRFGSNTALPDRLMQMKYERPEVRAVESQWWRTLQLPMRSVKTIMAQIPTKTIDTTRIFHVRKTAYCTCYFTFIKQILSGLVDTEILANFLWDSHKQ